MIYWLLTQTVPLIIITTVVNNRYMSIQNNEQTKSMNIQYQHDQTGDKCAILVIMLNHLLMFIYPICSHNFMLTYQA